jgi:AraC-like DNA-binding protein
MPKQDQQPTFQVDFGEAGTLARMKTEFLPDGAYRFHDELDITGVLKDTIITCNAWLVEFYELQSGELFFMRGEVEVRPLTKRFGVFYPSFSIAQPALSKARGSVMGLAALDRMPRDVSATPILFELNITRLPATVAEAIEILRAVDNPQSVESSPNASLLALKTKRLIDENYFAYPSIARIATRLGVTHEHLSRQFKRDFGMSPQNYLRQLRMADARLRLARGEEIVNVSQDVGYNDLSRFYKQFRKTTDTSPGACKTILRPPEK